MSRPLLADAQLSPTAVKAMNARHTDVLDAVRAAVQSDDVVVVGMGWNPHVGNARKALYAANIDFTYLGYGNYVSGWPKRLVIKLWSGWPTFPQVFVKGVLIGGNDDLQAALRDGTLAATLSSDI